MSCEQNQINNKESENLTIVDCPNCGQLKIIGFRYNQCSVCGSAVKRVANQSLNTDGKKPSR